jgi:hypothetical protein
MTPRFAELLVAIETEHRSEIQNLQNQVGRLTSQLDNVIELRHQPQDTCNPPCAETVSDNGASKFPSENATPRPPMRRKSTTPVWLSVQEDLLPTSDSRCRNLLIRIVISIQFEMAVGIMILANTAIMCAELQYQSLDVGYSIQFEGANLSYDAPGEEKWPGAETFFMFSERFFAVIFTLELLLRLGANGLPYFRVLPNWLDMIIVIIGLLDWLAASSTAVDPSVARLGRFGKLLRAFRMLRVSKVMENLVLILRCIRASVTTLCWSFVLLGTVQCVAGMVFSQLVRPALLDESVNLTARQELFRYYGSFSRSILTMFEVTLANWSPPCRVLVDYIGEEYTVIFLLYRCFAGFAILNVVQAVFIQSTMKVAQEDNDVMIMDRKRAQESYKRKLVHLFSQMDTSGDGAISHDEFRSMIRVQDICLLMGALGIDPSDLETLFRVLSNGKNEILIEDFIAGASKIRGNTKSIEIIQIMDHCRCIERQISRIASCVAALEADKMQSQDGKRDCCFGTCQRTTPPFDFVEMSAQAPSESLQCTNLLWKQPSDTLEPTNLITKQLELLPNASVTGLSTDRITLSGLDEDCDGPMVEETKREGSLGNRLSGTVDEAPLDERERFNALCDALERVPSVAAGGIPPTRLRL